MTDLSQYITEALFEPYLKLTIDGLQKASAGKISLTDAKHLRHIALDRITATDVTVYEVNEDKDKAIKAVRRETMTARSQVKVLAISFVGNKPMDIYTGLSSTTNALRNDDHTVTRLWTRYATGVGPGKVITETQINRKGVVDWMFQRDVDKIVIYNSDTIKRLSDAAEKKSRLRKDDREGATALVNPSDISSKNIDLYKQYAAYKEMSRYDKVIDEEKKRILDMLRWVIDNFDRILTQAYDEDLISRIRKIPRYIANFLSRARIYGSNKDKSFQDVSGKLSLFFTYKKYNADLWKDISSVLSTTPAGDYKPKSEELMYVPQVKSSLAELRDKLDDIVLIMSSGNYELSHIFRANDLCTLINQFFAFIHYRCLTNRTGKYAHARDMKNAEKLLNDTIKDLK